MSMAGFTSVAEESQYKSRHLHTFGPSGYCHMERDIAQGIKVAHALEAGTVWVNGYNLLDATSPWGGVKTSGLGREMGSDALQHYVAIKATWVNLE